MTIDFETHQTAEELYVLEGLTLDAVSRKTAIPKRTIELWSSEGGWIEKRKEYRRALGEIKRNTVLAKLEFIKGAMETLDPQKAYAFSSIMSATRAESLSREAGGQAASVAAVQAREIRTSQEAVEALEEAISLKLNLMLSNPDAVNLKAVKDLKDAMIIVDEMKIRWASESGVESGRQQGLDEEQVRFWREKVLGVR